MAFLHRAAWYRQSAPHIRRSTTATTADRRKTVFAAQTRCLDATSEAHRLQQIDDSHAARFAFALSLDGDRPALLNPGVGRGNRMRRLADNRPSVPTSGSSGFDTPASHWP